MDISKEELTARLKRDRFPRSSDYDAEWMVANQMGPNAVWLMEWLCEAMALEPGMRVLDMGCGKAMTPVFLAKEFGVRVWANDLWISAAENWQRVCEAGVEDLVCPIHAEARALPYAEGFFDALVSVDSYHYYGTDDLYLKYFASFVKAGGEVGIVVPGLMQEFPEGGVPEHLTRPLPDGSRFWDPAECWSIRTLEWWHRHWKQTELVDIETADTLSEGGRLWLEWAETLDAAGTGFPEEAPALRADEGRYLGFVRVVARSRAAPPSG